ncbi:hypothetical protein Tco_0212693 [Tanacetum coccineum]
MERIPDQGMGSTSGIRACALRYFDLEEMELENSQNNALAKLPMLKLGEYEMWEIRIKQYFQIQDYVLWEVIENGNSWVPIPVTAPESARFGGNEATKRTQKALLKQQYENFNDSSSKSLDSIFNRLQKLVSASSTTNINTVNPEISTGTTKVNNASTETNTASFSDATV